MRTATSSTPSPTDAAVFALAAQQECIVANHDLVDPGPYRGSIGVAVDGGVALADLQERATQLVQSSEVLRTTYRLPQAMKLPLQVVLPALPLVVEQREGPAAGDLDSIRRWLHRTRLDLVHGPVVRALLVRIDPDLHHLYLVAASATTDVTGLELLASRLLARPGNEPIDEPLQVVDYAEWTRTLRAEHGEGTTFWADRTAAIAPIGALATAPPHSESGRLTSRSWRLPADSMPTTATGGLAAHLLTSWQVVVARFFDVDRLTVAVRSGGRLDSELAGMIGPLARYLPVTADVEGAPSIRRLVDTNVGTLRDNERWHHHAPANVGHAQVGFAYHDAAVGDRRRVLLEEQLERFALGLSCRLDGDGVLFELTHDPTLVDEATATSLAASFRHVARCAADSPEVRPTHLGLLEPDVRPTVLRRAAGDPLEESGTSVLDLIETHARRTPDREALRWNGKPWTYGVLWQRSEQLATWLQARGIGTEDVVALHLRRAPSLIAAMLAVLRCGAAYVPLDPEDPHLRKEQVARDAAPVLVLTQRALLEQTPDVAPVACIDSGDVRAHPDATFEPRMPHPDALAYVIYTSGSTGRPKGVTVTHGALLASTAARFDVYGEPVERFLLLSSPAFDSSVAGIYWTLCSGGALVLPSDGAQRDAEELCALAAEHEVTHLLCLPSLYRLLLRQDPASLARLRVAIVAGERCPTDVLESHRRNLPDTRFFNEYGPTEATVWATVHEPASDGRGESVPIGSPVPGRRVYVLDPNGQLLPNGASGLIHIGGAGLARGYLHDPAATAACFVPDPYGDAAGARMYVTGDRGRAHPDGALEFLGRADDQVKLRGHRIELGAIEASLGAHPDVSEAAVVVNERGPSPRLTAFAVTVAGSVIRPTDAIAHLAARLPRWMVPATVAFVNKFPTLPNGKVDRSRLLDHEETHTGSSPPGRAPAGRIEEALARIWAEVLGCEDVGVDQNFFTLGGDSLLAIQIAERARREGVQVSARSLFRHPTIAELAELAERSGSDEPPVTDEDVTGLVPVTPIQRWFLDRRLREPNHYNQAILLESGPLDPELLARAVDAVVARHSALRLRIVGSAGEWHQRSAAFEPRPVLATLDVSGFADREEAIAREIDRAHRSLDIAEGPVTAIRHFQCGGGSDRLFWAVHHLAVDAISWRILVEDLESAYDALAAGKPVDLPAPSVDPLVWAHRVAELAGTPDVLDHRDEWEHQMSAPPLVVPVEATPDARARPTKVKVALLVEESRRVASLARDVLGCGLDDVLLASVAITLARWVGVDSCRLDSEHHGREDSLVGLDSSRAVGWFTSIYPVRLDLPDRDDGPAALAAAIQQLGAVPKSRLGFGVLASALPEARPAQVLFNYLGRIDDTAGRHGRLRLLDDDPGDSRSPLDPVAYRLEIDACLHRGRLEVAWSHDPCTLTAATVEQRASELLQFLLELVDEVGA